MYLLFKLREGLVVDVKSPSCDKLSDRSDDLLLGGLLSVLLSFLLNVLRFVIVEQIRESPLGFHFG